MTKEKDSPEKLHLQYSEIEHMLNVSDLSSVAVYEKLLLVDRTISLNTTKSRLAKLKLDEKIHICDWIRLEYSYGKEIKTCPRAVYRWGYGIDAKRPEPEPKIIARKLKEIEDDEIVDNWPIQRISKKFIIQNDPFALPKEFFRPQVNHGRIQS